MPTMQFGSASTLYYELIDASLDQPYLVFLHEGLGCIEMWKDFPRRLCASTGCPGLVYDRLGYGKSDPQSEPRTLRYLHDYAYQELPALLHNVIPDKHYILVGHSDGGSIALLHGATRPARLKALITEAAHVFVEPETITGITAVNEVWKAGKLQGLFKFHGQKTTAVFTSWATTWLSSWFKKWNIESQLCRIEKPLLVIQGGEDQYASAAQVDAIASGSGGDVQVEIIDKCGHTPHLEAHPLVLDLMTVFIRSQLALG